MTKLRTYSRKKSSRTLSRKLFLNIAELENSLADIQDAQRFVQDPFEFQNEALEQENNLFRTSEKTTTDSTIVEQVKNDDGNDDPIKEFSDNHRNSDESMEKRTEQGIKESPTKKRNLGKRVLKMKSSCKPEVEAEKRDDHIQISHGMNKVSLKDSGRSESLVKNSANHKSKIRKV